jgi:hypothetical protein
MGQNSQPLSPGVSIFIAVQNYVASGNEGIPKSIRGNINCCAIWKTGNLKELDLLTTELSGVLPKEEILEAYNYVMNKDPNNRHNFLFVDLTPKKHHPKPIQDELYRVDFGVVSGPEKCYVVAQDFQN